MRRYLYLHSLFKTVSNERADSEAARPRKEAVEDQDTSFEYKWFWGTATNVWFIATYC